MKYDDSSWHYEGNFPATSPVEYGATHIALFMRWCFCQGWAGQLHLEDSPDEVQRVIVGDMPATKFLLENCDGKLTDEDFNETGNAFAEKYYGDDGLYLDDYGTHFEDLMYVQPEEAHDFKAFSKVLDARYRSGILTASDEK